MRFENVVTNNTLCIFPVACPKSRFWGIAMPRNAKLSHVHGFTHSNANAGFNTVVKST